MSSAARVLQIALAVCTLVFGLYAPVLFHYGWISLAVTSLVAFVDVWRLGRLRSTQPRVPGRRSCQRGRITVAALCALATFVYVTGHSLTATWMVAVGGSILVYSSLKRGSFTTAAHDIGYVPVVHTWDSRRHVDEVADTLADGSSRQFLGATAKGFSVFTALIVIVNGAVVTADAAYTAGVRPPGVSETAAAPTTTTTITTSAPPPDMTTTTTTTSPPQCTPDRTIAALRLAGPALSDTLTTKMAAAWGTEGGRILDCPDTPRMDENGVWHAAVRTVEGRSARLLGFPDGSATLVKAPTDGFIADDLSDGLVSTVDNRTRHAWGDYQAVRYRDGSCRLVAQYFHDDELVAPYAYLPASVTNLALGRAANRGSVFVAHADPQTAGTILYTITYLSYLDGAPVSDVSVITYLSDQGTAVAAEGMTTDSDACPTADLDALAVASTVSLDR